MYGSAHELWENLKIFRNFSQSHQFFNTADEPYQTTPIIYRNSKNEEFICKSDLFAILQNITIRHEQELSFDVISIVAFFLKTQEEKLNGKMEFVRFNTKVLKKIEKELRQEIDKNTVVRIFGWLHAVLTLDLSKLRHFNTERENSYLQIFGPARPGFKKSTHFLPKFLKFHIKKFNFFDA